MKSLLIGLTGLTIALSLGTAATAGCAAASATTAMPAKLSVEDTTIGDLLASPVGKAVLTKDMPDLVADPRMEMAKGMTLRAIVPFSEGKLDDAKLAALQKDLDEASVK